MAAEPDVVESSLVAVLPGVILRGTTVGIVIAGFAYVYLFRLWEWTQSVLAPVSGQRYVVTFAAVPATLLVVLALASLEYNRRRYELGADELTEYRGVLWTRSDSLSYEDVTDVHLSQSPLQGLFGVGTVRINDQDVGETGETEAMRLRFVERPATVYERLRDDAGRSFSAPRMTVRPDPMTAARTSAYRGVALGALTGFVPVALFAAALEGRGVPAGHGLLAGVGLVLLLVLARAAHIYRVYDQRQYEIYADRVEDVGGVSTTAVGFDDVNDVVVYESLGRLGLAEAGRSVRESAATADVTGAGTNVDDSGPVTGGSRNRIDLIDVDGDALLSLRYISDVERVQSHLVSIVDFDSPRSRDDQIEASSE